MMVVRALNVVPSQVSYTSIPQGISAGEQRVFPRTDATAPPAASSSRILTHHQSASNVVHANTACHIAFLLSLLGLDQRLLAFGCCQSRGTMADPLGPSSGICAFAKPGDQWLADPIMGDDHASGRQRIWPPKPSTQASSGDTWPAAPASPYSCFCGSGCRIVLSIHCSST